MKLEDATHITAGAMDQILACFKSGSKITVLVRTPGLPDRDFCMTDDNLSEVAEMIERRRQTLKGGE
ncbi:hypothetical protein RI570_17555 [Brucella pseudogrignonensis]|uniref:hypothetical protein n=1 Tax=Brucella pseudogrignonensis TaxID=419475 RepID=UPI0028B6899D|nr:hypothetical protein [Brucella pseudogrignonensis]MDT6941912.1 hypothetical protein [Brucella pseudogrignonensis]